MIFLLLSAFVAQAKYNGVIYLSWNQGDYSSSYSDMSISKLASETQTEYVALVQTWYQDNYLSTEIIPTQFSETDNDIRHAASQLKLKGIKVAFKPHVDLYDDSAHWRGDIGTAFTGADWESWFGSYESFINASADLAKDIGAELFVIGSDLIYTERQETYWRQIIANVRERVDSTTLLVYGSNWYPGPSHVQFWDALDYIGVDAYYPLSNTWYPTPTVQNFTQAWEDLGIISNLESISTQYDKKVIFTEIGYPAKQGCSMSPSADPIPDIYEPQCQLNAYEAFFIAVYTQSWFDGMFFYAWSTNPSEGGRCDVGYSPRNQTAGELLSDPFNNLPNQLATSNNLSLPEQAITPVKIQNKSSDAFRLSHPLVAPLSLIKYLTLGVISSLTRSLSTGIAANSPAMVSAQWTPPLKVYDCIAGATGDGWSDESWSCVTNLQDQEVFIFGCFNSMAVTMNPYGAVRFHYPAGFNVSGYTGLRLAIDVSENSTMGILLYATDIEGAPQPGLLLHKYTDACVLPSGGFGYVIVPLADLVEIDIISDIIFKNNNPTDSLWWFGGVEFY